MGHALAHGVMGFGVARFLLGLGEGGNFPASIKTVAEWFPKKERAFATAVFNSAPPTCTSSLCVCSRRRCESIPRT
jgi:MFS family permease